MARLSGKSGQKAFLAAFAECGQITKAAKSANVNRRAHYDWIATVPDYPARFAEASVRAGDALEDEATRRAHEGIVQAEWYQGKAVGTKRVYSDGLMMFLLRGLKPAKFRQTGAVEISGPGGGPITLEQKQLAILTDDELAALVATTKKLTLAGSDGGGTAPTSPK